MCAPLVRLTSPTCEVTFGDAHAGEDGEQHQRVVATAEPAASVWRGEQRLDLVEVEVGTDALP